MARRSFTRSKAHASAIMLPATITDPSGKVASRLAARALAIIPASVTGHPGE
jgi:hypothetical protein